MDQHWVNHWVNEEITRDTLKTYLYKYKNTIYQNLWNAAEAVFRGVFKI